MKKAAGRGLGDGVGPYALWLVPEKRALEMLSGWIEELSRRPGRFSFMPHATLCSGDWLENRVMLVDAAERVAREVSPVTAALDGFGQEDVFFRYFYLQLEPGGLEDVRNAADEFMAEARLPAVPHISLAYDDGFSGSCRAVWAREYAERLPGQIVFDRLALVVPGPGGWGAVADWQTLHTAALAG